MKKIDLFKRLLAAVISIIMLFGCLSVPISAAKEMFTTYQISSVAITGIDPPKAGDYFDFTAEENSQKYDIIKVVWQQQYSDGYITDPSAVVQPGIVYSVCVILEVATPNHYFITGEGRVSAVPSVTVNGQTAHADNVQDYELFSIDASKYEHDTTYQRFLRVWYTFPEVPEGDQIENFEIVIDTPTAGELPATKADVTTVNGGENVGYINFDDIVWSYQSGQNLSPGTTFEYGENYTVTFYLRSVRSRKFATDPSHFLATPGNPFPAVTATVNGKNATVLPNGSASTDIIVSAVLTCEGIGEISSAEVTVTPPKSGEAPDYYAAANGMQYTIGTTKDRFTSGGVSWFNKTDDTNMYVSIDKFEGGKTYSVTVELNAADGYEFPNSSIPAFINGRSAEFWSRDEYTSYLIYTFEALPEDIHVCSALKVDEVKATCTDDGKKAHYFCPECGKFFEDSKCSKEITKINAWGIIPAEGHSGGKATCAEKAKCRDCGAPYGEFAEHNYSSSWDYKDGTGHAHKCNVCGNHDTVIPHSGGTASCGKPAKCAECKEEYGSASGHQWSSSYEYTNSDGHAKKCTVCGEHDTLQVHSGGTADCKNKAECSVCGKEYGKTGDHNWGSSYEYTNSDGHAKKCTVCGDHDTVQAHSGGTSDCQNKAKCLVCGKEYGKTGEHKWGSSWDYSDAKGHAHLCTVKGCTEHSDTVKHTPGSAATESAPQTCTTCNYVIEPAKKHEHNLTKINSVKATCTETGTKEHYICEGCGKIFSDSKGNKEAAKDSLIIPAEGHKESKWQSDGDKHWKECTRSGCNTVIESTKAAHDFAKNKCSVCGFKRTEEQPETTAAPSADQETEKVPETTANTSEPADETEPTADLTGENQNPGSTETQPVDTENKNPAETDTDKSDDISENPGNSNTAMWIIVITAVGVAAVCVIALTVVIVKKK